MSSLDVAALGEILIDFTFYGKSPSGGALFERNAGGAPANVLAAVSRLGGKSAFIGKAGNDDFGVYLKATLEKYGVDTSGLSFCPDIGTTLAFVNLAENGERSFCFYRKSGADIMLSVDDVDTGIIDKAKIFHFGSLSMTDEPSKSATLKALDYAKSKGKIISYDPNYRPALWSDKKTAVNCMKLGLQYADIVKITDEELSFISGCDNYAKNAARLIEGGVKVVFVTGGDKGCYFRFNGGEGSSCAYNTRIVDTTGCGDAFMGAVLYKFRMFGVDLSELDLAQLKKIADFANAAGAACATRKGAIPAMPSLGEIEGCMAGLKRLPGFYAESEAVLQV